LRLRPALKIIALGKLLIIAFHFPPQAGSSGLQIPAKAYEYLRLRRPIFALTTQTGATAALLRKVGGATIASLSDEFDVHEGLSGFMEKLRLGIHASPDLQRLERYSRRRQAQDLAKCLSKLIHEQQEVLLSTSEI
jgi:hypothetical protein